MNDCCSTSDGCGQNKKQRCPINGCECSEVSTRTILHHIEHPWAWTPTATRYFFCEDPHCEVVYFGDDSSIIQRSLLRSRTAARENDRLLCYCFDVTETDYRHNPAVKDFVIAQTKAGQCSCETSNPSGKCCLKDFAKQID